MMQVLLIMYGKRNPPFLSDSRARRKTLRSRLTELSHRSMAENLSKLEVTPRISARSGVDERRHCGVSSL
jgi:hypothetical protein